MKMLVKCLLVLILAVQITLGALSEGNDGVAYTPEDNMVEIVWGNVNMREEPNGEIIGRFTGGEIITWLGEKRKGGELWYHVKSNEYGNGYVKAVYAMPSGIGRNGITIGGESSALTDCLLSYYEALQRFQFKHGYRVWQGSADHSVCNTKKVGNEVDERIDIVLLMYSYGIIAQDGNKSLLCDSSAPLEKRHRTACEILRTHYGTDDLWYIFTAASSVGIISIRPEDWHSPENATSDEKVKFYNMIQSVEEEFRENTVACICISPVH